MEPPSSRGQQFEATSRIYALASNITSVFALFIGMFIIYNTFAIAVTQRRSEIGILRALGATRGQIRTLFLAESALTGLAGTLLGRSGRIAAGARMAGYIGGLLDQAFTAWRRARVKSLSIRSWWRPRHCDGPDHQPDCGCDSGAQRRARGSGEGSAEGTISVAERRRKPRAAELGHRRAPAGPCAALGFSRIGIVFYAGYLLAVLAAVLLSPALSLWLARVLRPVLAWLRPVEGTLAADSLIQAPRRTSGTVAALMLSLALVISLGGLARASYNSISDWMHIALSPDLFITTAENITERSFAFPASLGEGLRAIDGVGEVQLVRSVRVLVKGTPIMIVATDVGALERHAQLPTVEGDSRTMYRVTAEGKGVLASENFARLHGAHLGEILEFPAPSGVLRLPIVGLVRDFSDQQGSILMSRDVFTRSWMDDSVNVFRIYLKPGAVEAQVRQSILSTYGSRQRLFVLTNEEVRGYITRLTDQWFGLTYVQIAVAVLVAVLGIVNALTVSITDRRRELGVLQAVGGLRRQVRHTIWMEAAAIGAIGLILGLTLGAIQLYYSVEIARRDLIGMDLGYAYPFQTALALAPVILGAAFLAALGPAESAVRGSLVEALEYE